MPKAAGLETASQKKQAEENDALRQFAVIAKEGLGAKLSTLLLVGRIHLDLV